MRRLLTHQFRRTTLWLVFFIAITLGIGLSKSGRLLNGWWCLALLVIARFAIRQRKLPAVLVIILLGVSLGWLRGEHYRQQLSAYQIPISQKVTITAQALDDGLYGSNQQLGVDANNVVLANGQTLPGKIELSGFGMNAIFAGDVVLATGRLNPGFGSYAGQMSFAKLSLVSHKPTLVYETRRKFTSGMLTALPEPSASFAMGLLVGQRATLPADIKQDLLMVGLTHIIAVSGYNLTIILHAAQKMFGRLSKRIATFLSLALIFGFLLLAGSSASIVRAAMVSTLSIAASYYGRSFRPLNLIMLAAAITAWANPIYVWSDISWYLSFLAFYGVMVLSPLVQARWPGHWHQTIAGGVALESICAEVMSLPFILFTFGQLSLVGLPANILITTLVPLAMLLGFIAGLAGVVMPAFVGWLAWPARYLLGYMLSTAHLLAALPHVFIQNRSLSLGGMLGLYGLVIGISLLLWHKTKPPRHAIITDRNERTQQVVND